MRYVNIAVEQFLLNSFNELDLSELDDSADLSNSF